MASSSSGARKGDWKECIINQIQMRNQVECAPYQDLIQFHSRLFDSCISLKEENMRLNVECQQLRGGEGGGSGPSSSALVQQLERKVLEQAEELTELHRKRGENGTLVVSLTDQLSSLKQTLDQKNDRISELMIQESLIKQERDSYKVVQEQMESKFQMLKDEFQALQLTATHLEEKLRKVQCENIELVSRIKEYKSKDAEKMNEENENFIRKRNALMQKELEEAARETKCHPVGIEDVGIDALTLPGGPGLPTTPAIIWDAHDGEVNAVQYSPGSDFVLATGGTDKMVKLWDTNRGKAELKGQLVGSNQGIMSLVFDSTGTLIMGTSTDQGIRVWGVNDQRNRRSLTGHSSKVLAAKFIEDLNQVVSGSHDRTIKFWDLNKNACSDTRFSKSYCNDLVVWDSQARTVISGHYDKTAKFWDVRQGSGFQDMGPVRVVHLAGNVTSLALSKDGWTLLACVRDDSLKLVDLRMNEILRTFSAEGFVVSCDWSRASFSCDSEYVAVGGLDGRVYIWNTLTANLETTLIRHTSSVIAVAWHPIATNRLVSVDKNKKAIVWSS